MKDEPQIPLLQDLIYKGRVKSGIDKNAQSFDENSDFEIEQDEQDILIAEAEEEVEVGKDNYDMLRAQEFEAEAESEIDSDPVQDLSEEQELIEQDLFIEDEIRLILDRHRDEAYAEIMQLLNK